MSGNRQQSLATVGKTKQLRGNKKKKRKTVTAVEVDQSSDVCGQANTTKR